jgi:aminoglycoside phosphotransferase (APT) family kinase protein
VRSDDLYGEVRGILATAGRRLGVPTGDAELLHLHSNAIFVLPSAGLLVRISTNPDALARVTTSVRVTRWLAGRGFPCVVPAGICDQPLVEGGLVVSVWEYVPTVPEARPGGADLGRLLRALHSQPAPPDPPARLTDPLASVACATEDAPPALPRAYIHWLADRIYHLREAWRTLDFPNPACLIHGDAHPGNLLRTPGGHVILGDWDHVAFGPREWDLGQVHYTRRRFGRPPDDELDRFAAAYGWDVRVWEGLPTVVAIREVTGLSAYLRTAATKPFSRRELVHRLDTLRRDDATARWNPPPAERPGAAGRPRRL